MANTVDKVLSIAEAEVGYLEKSKSAYQKDPNVIYSKTEGAGYDNYTKYGKEMHDLYPSVMDFPASYCDAHFFYCVKCCFVSCWKRNIVYRRVLGGYSVKRIAAPYMDS